MTSRHGARLAVSLTKRVKEEPSRAIVKGDATCAGSPRAGRARGSARAR